MASLRVVNMAGESILESDLDDFESLQDGTPDFSSCWATNPNKQMHFLYLFVPMFWDRMSQKKGCDSWFLALWCWYIIGFATIQNFVIFPCYTIRLCERLGSGEDRLPAFPPYSPSWRWQILGGTRKTPWGSSCLQSSRYWYGWRLIAPWPKEQVSLQYCVIQLSKYYPRFSIFVSLDIFGEDLCVCFLKC